MTEYNRLEYKRELTDKLEREAVAFFNANQGGEILFGVDNDGSIAGLEDADDIQLKIKDRLKNNLRPSVMGLFSINLEKQDGKQFIRLTLASGSEKPYHIRKYGMSERGCYIRVGSACEPMTQTQIDDQYSRRVRNSINKIPSPRQDLRFEQLHIYYQERGLKLNDQFASNLGLLTEDNKYNLAAYLLADENSISIQVARYDSIDKDKLSDKSQLGYCSLVKACKQVLDKLDIANKIGIKITSSQRKEVRLWGEVAIREAVINAFVHHDYTNEHVPVFEVFPDRLEITSSGHVPIGPAQDEFFGGYSDPKNTVLMRVFNDLGLVEQLGSGMTRILKVYAKDNFAFSQNFIRLTAKNNPEAVELMTKMAKDGDGASEKDVVENTENVGVNGQMSEKTPENGVENPKNVGVNPETVGTNEKPSVQTPETVGTNLKTSVQILQLLEQAPTLTAQDLADKTKLSKRNIERHLQELKAQGRLKRIGPNKGGHWEVLTKGTNGEQA